MFNVASNYIVMSLSTEDAKLLGKLNAVFTRIENEADLLGLTPDESFARYKEYNVGGVGYFDQDSPSVGFDRANIFAKATEVKKAATKVK